MTSRNYVFTLNNYTDDEVQTIKDTWTTLKLCYYIANKEVSASGTPHLQGYFELRGNSRRIPGTIAFLGISRMRLDRRRGTREQAITYCLKEVADGELPFLESSFGDRLSDDRGTRSDLHQFTALLSSGGSMAAGALLWPATYVRNYRGLRSFQELQFPPQARGAHTCDVLWGPTGTGKSRFCAEQWPSAFWFPRPVTQAFFGGYVNQSVTILDDFYSWLPFETLLRMLDRYPFNANVMGNFVPYLATHTIITSNDPPSSWYPNLPNRDRRFPALLRRLTHITHYNLPLEHPDFDVGEPTISHHHFQ